MPITQSRMIALIEEAQALHAALRDLRTDTQRLVEYLRDGLMAKEEVIAALQHAIANSRTQELEALPVEAAHFRKMQGHNQHRMLAQRAARGGTARRTEGSRSTLNALAERILPQTAPDRAAMRKHIEAVLAKSYEAPPLPPDPTQHAPAMAHQPLHTNHKQPAPAPHQDPTTSALPQHIEIEGGMGEIGLDTNPKDLL